MDASLPPSPLSASPVVLAEDLAARVDVSVDPVLNLVTYTLAGFLDADAVRQVGEAQAAAMTQLRCAKNGHVTMIDIAQCKIQPQDVIEAFRGMLEDPRYQGRKVAVVVGSSLARMQIRRVLHRDTVHYVETRAEARRWLLSAA